MGSYIPSPPQILPPPPMATRRRKRRTTSRRTTRSSPSSSMSTLKGRDVAATISTERHSIERSIRDLDTQIASSEAVISKQTSIREDALTKLAAIWLQDGPECNRVVASLHQVSSRLQTIYDERARRRTTINQHLEQLASAESLLEGQIAEAQATIEAREQEVGRIKGLIEEALKQDEAYGKLRAEWETLRADLHEADSRKRDISEECDSKARAYEDDPLFCYLGDRRYGTEHYQKGLLSAGDHWLARAIGYAEAKRHYDLLVEMPKHLDQTITRHATRLKEVEVSMAQIEVTYATQHGLGTAQAMLESAQATKESRAEELEANRGAQEGLRTEKTAIDQSMDPFTKEAKRALKACLGDTSVAALRERAAQTHGTDDDRLVRALEEAEDHINRERKEAKRLIELRSQEEQKLSRVQTFESRFSRLDYDGSRSRFDSSLDVPSLMAGYMAGSLSESAAFGKLESAHSVERSSSSSYSGSSSSSWSSSSSSSDSYSSSSSSSYDSGGGFGDSGGGGSDGGF